MKTFFNITVLLFGLTISAQPNHGLWTEILQTHVSKTGLVDYKLLKKDPQILNVYLNELVAHQPQPEWSENAIKSYWINAYNAYTLKLILDHYPVESIKDIQDPWNKKFIPYQMDLISLNEIEHDILRKMDDPRIHFAIVCASLSCPQLCNTAFKEEGLETHLDKATVQFLKDKNKNNFSENKAELSKIFKWFAGDFKSSGGVIAFIKGYIDVNLNDRSQIRYKPYSWELNE